MRHTLVVFVALCAATQPARAQLTTAYAGWQLVGGQQIPATAVFSISAGHVAAVIKGSVTARMLFDQKAQVLHLVNDNDKTYLDIYKGGAGGPMDMMQQQLAKMPPDQRAQAEAMMKGMMASAVASSPPLTYDWTNQKNTVLGYECTLVEGMRGTAKVTEYCGSTSDDFKMDSDERATILEMQDYLRNFSIGVKGPDDNARLFQWDTNADGYPVISRCFDAGVMTLNLTLDSTSRKPIPREVFEIPPGYKKVDLGGGMGGRGGRKPPR
jgi:hypothetical protein